MKLWHSAFWPVGFRWAALVLQAGGWSAISGRQSRLPLPVPAKQLMLFLPDRQRLPVCFSTAVSSETVRGSWNDFRVNSVNSAFGYCFSLSLHGAVCSFPCDSGTVTAECVLHPLPSHSPSPILSELGRSPSSPLRSQRLAGTALAAWSVPCEYLLDDCKSISSV